MKKPRVLYALKISFLVSILALSAGVLACATDEPEVVRILTLEGNIAPALRNNIASFTAETGIEVEVEGKPFSDIYATVLTDIASGANAYDAYVFAPQWIVDFADGLEDITSKVNADDAIEWEDIAPFFRDFSTQYQGRIYTVPVDGDFQMVYYRIDILDSLGLDPPNTWEDYINIARAADGRDTDGDGTDEYGSCIAKKPSAQSYWMFISVASAFLQTQGTAQGAFFSTDDMTPLYNNPAVAEALRIYKDSTQYGPPDELNLDVGDTRGLFTSGRCALSIDWGDIGTQAIGEGSLVNGKTGAVILPGSSTVWNRETSRMETCNSTLCPHADSSNVNHAPFAAFGGWSGAINASAPNANKDAAYQFLSWVSRPANANVDVTNGATGFNPYRVSQFDSTTLWENAGMTRAAAENYLGAIGASLDSPNLVLDLRVPQNNFYQQVILDAELSKYLAGNQDEQTTMANIERAWEEKTEELGRDSQLDIYKDTLGAN